MLDEWSRTRSTIRLHCLGQGAKRSGDHSSDPLRELAAECVALAERSNDPIRAENGERPACCGYCKGANRWTTTRTRDDAKRNGRSRSTTIVSEAGVYRLTMVSEKPFAKQFQRWLFHEVLPEIRRTGSYHGEPGQIENFVQRSVCSARLPWPDQLHVQERVRGHRTARIRRRLRLPSSSDDMPQS